MGISFEAWVHCDNCEEGKSFHPEDVSDSTDTNPNGFEWRDSPDWHRGDKWLLCWDCIDELES